MTDQDLIHHLRNSKGWPTLGNAAADRIEALRAALAAERDALEAENERLREAALDAAAHLVAATSLLRKGGKKAAPSNKMFAQMLVDYEAAIERTRAALAKMGKTDD